ncbi:MAG TPA: DegT/DnrJ/EryC1/StrS family aminotransferase, partial [Gammaproteobacteria bacterium]
PMPKAKRTILYGGAVIGPEEIEAVTDVMRTSMIVGDKVARFEKRCAALLGKKHGVMVNSGSSALMVAMRLLDLPKGSEVITSALTFSTDVASIVHAGYVPAFVDCEIDTFQIDISRIERMIGPRSKALLVPDLIGGMPDWDRLRALADRHGLMLIEDSCDTLGGRFRGRPAGERSDLSVTSFSLYHIITALGNGGLVAFDDERLWDRALQLRAWGRSSEDYLYGSKQAANDGRFVEHVDGVPYDGMFIFNEIAYGFCASEAGAAFGLAQLDKLDSFTRTRTRLFDRHTEFLRLHDDVFITPRVLEGVETTWICYPVILRPELGWSRTELQAHLEDNGIATRMIFSGNITRQPMMREIEFRADADGYPAADTIMEHGVMLPCHPTMTDDDCDYLYETLEEFIAARR